MKKRNPLVKINNRMLAITVSLGTISLALFTILFVELVRARVIDINTVVKEFETQREEQLYNPNFVPRVVEQDGLDYHKTLDLRCLTWSTYKVGSGWSRDSKDSDFVIDYYVPPNKNTIICTTPALAIALKAKSSKPFVYEAYPTEYGLRIRIIIGASRFREICQNLTGNVNCVNFILSEEAVVRYEP